MATEDNHLPSSPIYILSTVLSHFSHFSQRVTSNPSQVSRKRLIHPVQTTIYISPDKCVYMNNLWRDVILSQEKAVPVWQAQYFRAVVCVDCVCAYTAVCLPLFALINPLKCKFRASDFRHFSTPFLSSLITSTYWDLLLSSTFMLFSDGSSADEDKNSVSCVVFTNPYSSRFEIKVDDGKDKRTKLAETQVQTMTLTVNTFLFS